MGAGGGLGIRDLIDIHVNNIIAAHLGGHGEVADNDVLLRLHIVVIIVAVGVAPLAFVVVFLIVVALAVPVVGFHDVVVDHGFLHLFGGEGIVGGAEVEAQLIHRAGLHLDIVGEHDGEGLPLVGIRVVDGEAHLLLQTAGLTHAVGLGDLVVLQEREDVVVIDADDPQRHRVQADGVEIHRGLVHIGDDDAVVGPTHLGQVVGEVEGVVIVALQQHAIVGTDAAAHRHIQVLQLIAIQGRLVEIEVDLVTLDISLIAQLFVEAHEAGEVLALFQRLSEEQRALAGRLVDVEHHGLEAVFGIDGQVAFHLSLAVQGLAVEEDRHLIGVVLTLEVLHFKVVDVVAGSSHLHGMALAERVVKQVDDLVLVDGHGKRHTQQVVHRLVGGADGLRRDEAEVLAAHTEAELKSLVGGHIHEVRHLELTDVVLVLVDVVVLETDGVLVDPHSLTLQRG